MPLVVKAYRGGINGGGILILNTVTAQLVDCQLIQNQAVFGGAIGGSQLSGVRPVVSPTLTNCLFLGNTALSHGGAIGGVVCQVTPVATNCVFMENTAIGQNSDSGTIGVRIGVVGGTYTRCLFTRNTAARSGGAIGNAGGAGQGRLEMIGCQFLQNSAQGGGGGAIYIIDISGRLTQTVKLTNCSFTQNSAVGTERSFFMEGGGALCFIIYSGGGQLESELINCSFAQNTLTGDTTLGGAVFLFKATGYATPPVVTGSLTNCLLWQNGGANAIRANEGDDPNPALIQVNYSLLETSTGYTGANNGVLTQSPFVDADAGNLQLTACSPAVNAGDPASTPATSGTTDAAGQPRFFQNGRIDIGAFERQGGLTASLTNSGDLTCARTSATLSATASTTVDQTTTVAPPSLLTAGGQSSITLPQYWGSVTLLVGGCPGGSIRWSGPNSTTGTGTITVPTTQTGQFVYWATCQLGVCTSGPVSATVTVQAEGLKLLVERYDCASRQLILRTTGGNGQAVEYHINSATTGWDQVSNRFVPESKLIGRELKLRARQRNSSGGWDETSLNFTPPPPVGAGLVWQLSRPARFG